MTRNQPHLTNGSQWSDHKNFILGNEDGLQNLIKACKKALETGECQLHGLGDYHGVKKLQPEWFEDPLASAKPSPGADYRLLIFSAAVGLLAVYGLYSLTLSLWPG